MSNTTIGTSENIAGLLAYVLGWISGLVLILIEKENSFVRFHAMQSIVTFGGLTLASILLSAIPVFFLSIFSLINLLGLALWVLLMIKAYQGERFHLPVIGELSEDWAKKIKL